jgi:hypothetical protein
MGNELGGSAVRREGMEMKSMGESTNDISVQKRERSEDSGKAKMC